MNVSMMDAYNLSWKLAYEILGLTTSGIELLDSYETERKEIARELINFDTQFSSMFSGKIGPAKEGEQVGVSLTHEQFLEVFSTGSGFTSGCGIQYPQGKLVQKSAENNEHPTSNQDLLNGKLCAGRRLINTRVIRHADGNPRNLQDGKHTQAFYCLSCSDYEFRFLINRAIPRTLIMLNRCPQSLRSKCRSCWWPRQNPGIIHSRPSRDHNIASYTQSPWLLVDGSS